MDELGLYSTYDNICKYLLKDNSFDISLGEYHEILKNREKNNYKGHTFFDLNILTLYDEVIDVFKYNNFLIKNCNFSFLKVTRNMYQGRVHVFFSETESKFGVKTENINGIEKKNDTKSYNKKGNKTIKINDKKNFIINLKVCGNVVANIKDVLKDTFDSLIFYMIDKYNIKLKINHSYRVKETTNYILLNEEIYKFLYNEDYFRIDLNKLQFDIKDYSFIFYKNVTNFVDYFKYIKDIHSSAYIISLLVRILADKNRIQKYSAQLFFTKRNDECICSLYLRFIKQNQNSFEKAFFNSKLVCIKNIIDSLISLIEETKKRLMNGKNLTYPDEFLLCSFVKSFYSFKLIDLENFKRNNQGLLYNKNELKKNGEYHIPIVKKELNNKQTNINEKDTCLENNSLKCKLNEIKNNKFSNLKNNTNMHNNNNEDSNKSNEENEKKTEMRLSCYDILKSKYSHKKYTIRSDDLTEINENNNCNIGNIQPCNSNHNNRNNRVRNSRHDENNIITHCKNNNSNVDINNKNDYINKSNSNIRNNINEDRNSNYSEKNNKSGGRNNKYNNNSDIEMNNNNNNKNKKHFELKNSYNAKLSSNNRRNSFNFKSTNKTNDIMSINNESCENIKNYEEKIHYDIKNDSKSKRDNKLKNYIDKKCINNITSPELFYTLNGNDIEISVDLHEEYNNKKLLNKVQNNTNTNTNIDNINSDKLINTNEKDNMNKEHENNNILNLKRNSLNEEIFNKNDNKIRENNYEEICENTTNDDIYKSVSEEIFNNFKKKESELYKNSGNKRKIKEYKISTDKNIIFDQMVIEDDSKENRICINNVRNRIDFSKNNEEERENENLRNLNEIRKKKLINIYENNNNKINSVHNVNSKDDDHTNQINLYDYCSYYSSFSNHDNPENYMNNREIQNSEEIRVNQNVQNEEKTENNEELKNKDLQDDEILKDDIEINEEIENNEINRKTEENDNIKNYYFFEEENIINRKEEIIDNPYLISNITNNCKILLNCLYEELPIKNEVSSDGEKKEIDNFSVIKKISENFIYLNNHDKVNVINVLYNYESLLKRILHYEYIKKDYSFEIETCKFYLDHISYNQEKDSNEKSSNEKDFIEKYFNVKDINEKYLNEKDIMNSVSDYDKYMNENHLIHCEKAKKKNTYNFLENNKINKLVDKINYYDEKIKILHKIISTYTKINLSHLDNIKSYVELTEYIKLCSFKIYHNESISENENENIYLNNFKMQINEIKYKNNYCNDIFYENVNNYKFEKDEKKDLYLKKPKDLENAKKCKNILKRKFQNCFNEINTCDNRNGKEIVLNNSIFDNKIKYNKNQNIFNHSCSNMIHDNTSTNFKQKKKFGNDSISTRTQRASF
ncbi:conserved Plasmodium protein, unknown function [Plasmodium relictum]|uniref:Uncharacterized protein n=1 Tax=Plasmodium relictum TaxID=85471 RepID=A0A1J1H928_PLARL|nr:conserved Plasmodium protein, unknown function [Plasmodium relictum]CRH01141.1 conserved Plasmodium protein, unknown function [Plasmodium relictum]